MKCKIFKCFYFIATFIYIKTGRYTDFIINQIKLITQRGWPIGEDLGLESLLLLMFQVQHLVVSTFCYLSPLLFFTFV